MRRNLDEKKSKGHSIDTAQWFFVALAWSSTLVRGMSSLRSLPPCSRRSAKSCWGLSLYAEKELRTGSRRRRFPRKRLLRSTWKLLEASQFDRKSRKSLGALTEKSMHKLAGAPLGETRPWWQQKGGQKLERLVLSELQMMRSSLLQVGFERARSP